MMISLILSIVSFVVVVALILAKITLIFTVVAAFFGFVVLRKIFRGQRKPNLDFMPKAVSDIAPSDWDLRKSLKKAHENLLMSLRQHPELKEDFENLWDSFCLELEKLSDPIEWKTCTQKLLEEWPRPKMRIMKSDFESVIEKTRRSFDLWQQSEMEVARVRRQPVQY